MCLEPHSSLLQHQTWMVGLFLSLLACFFLKSLVYVLLVDLPCLRFCPVPTAAERAGENEDLMLRCVVDVVIRLLLLIQQHLSFGRTGLSCARAIPCFILLMYIIWPCMYKALVLVFNTQWLQYSSWSKPDSMYTCDI
ncbi:hypothetical protein BDV28DRAFT_21712 [Aspergillus coremiiformis]|uniref:Uncharacterized protein n=1 Tax=Aspergillus coremiiformis TaxID=138285 RepID=A0A5N6Z1N4_9EURO|nr:hypothetical protein BDV28DRAFT_21712 [Aspergillus coremiiformis]